MHQKPDQWPHEQIRSYHRYGASTGCAMRPNSRRREVHYAIPLFAERRAERYPRNRIESARHIQVEASRWRHQNRINNTSTPLVSHRTRRKTSDSIPCTALHPLLAYLAQMLGVLRSTVDRAWTLDGLRAVGAGHCHRTTDLLLQPSNQHFLVQQRFPEGRRSTFATLLPVLVRAAASDKVIIDTTLARRPHPLLAAVTAKSATKPFQ